MKLYRAKLKPLSVLAGTMPPSEREWWTAFIMGKPIILRDATCDDFVNSASGQHQATSPTVYLCQRSADSRLIKRSAVASLEALPDCHACKHLAWHDDDGVDGHPGNEGYGCNMRDDGGMNTVQLGRLQDQAYRRGAKRCFDPHEASVA